MIFQNFILIFSFFSITQAWFDFKLHYCRFKCEDPCKDGLDKNNPNGEALVTKGYYFRDFLGVIPPDALPLGKGNQYPQTYVGLVFDPDDHGVFVTTIVEGLDYVYVAKDGKVEKLTNTIQILCTMEKKKMMTAKLTEENIKSFGNIVVAQGGVHYEKNDKNQYIKQIPHYITIITKCDINYAGSAYKLDVPVEYATFDGKAQISNDYEFLIYDNNTSDGMDQKNKGRPFFSHHYDYSIRPNSIIPKFYKQLNIGSCSMICTNEGLNANAKFKHDKKAAMSLAYYWKPSNIFEGDKTDAFGVVTKDYDNKTKTIYMGQTYYDGLNLYDVGSVSESFIFVAYQRNAFGILHEYHVFSTKYPEKFEWVPFDPITFPHMDKSKLVCGGKMANGTEIYFCKENKEQSRPGSLLIGIDSFVCASYYNGIGKNFSILQYVS